VKRGSEKSKHDLERELFKHIIINRKMLNLFMSRAHRHELGQQTWSLVHSTLTFKISRKQDPVKHITESMIPNWEHMDCNSDSQTKTQPSTLG